MSVIFGKGQGVEVRLHPAGTRYTGPGFKTKKRQRRQRQEKAGVEKPTAGEGGGEDPNRHGLLGAGERRLDYVKAYKSRELLLDTYIRPENG